MDPPSFIPQATVLRCTPHALREVSDASARRHGVSNMIMFLYWLSFPPSLLPVPAQAVVSDLALRGAQAKTQTEERLRAPLRKDCHPTVSGMFGGSLQLLAVSAFELKSHNPGTAQQ